jgi:hypothetical protein
MITDGVVDAQNRGGELFGFERAAAMSTRTAEEIARAAQAFGQEDDITVPTLMRSPFPTRPRSVAGTGLSPPLT